MLSAIAPVIVLAAAVFAAFGAALWYGFLEWDDRLLIVDNPLVRRFSPGIFWSYDPELYIPLTLLSFQVEHLIAGLNPAVFHAVNLALHVLNAALVWRLIDALLRQTTRGDRVATHFPHVLQFSQFLSFAVALLFAVHPLHTEAVVWISARKELLATAFGLAAILMHLRWRETGRSSQRWWSVGLFACSLAAKATALLLPAVLMVLDVARGRRCDRRLLREHAPGLAISAIFAAIAFVGREHALALGTLQGFLLAVRSTAFYLQKLVLPLDLSPLYPAPVPLSIASPAVLLSLAIVAGLIAAAWLLRRRAPFTSAGIASFLLLLVPSFFAFERSDEILLAADRYAYFPSVGILLVVSLVIAAVMKKIPTVSGIVGSIGFLGILVTLIALSRAQTRIWRDTDSLFRHALELAPSSPVALNNVGAQALARGELDRALEYAQAALAIRPDYPDALVNVAVIHGRRGEFDEAESLLRRALAIDPSHAQSHFNLAGVHLKRGDAPEAVRLYRRTLELRPLHVPALWQLAQLELAAGEMEEARAHYRLLLSLEPSFAGKLPSLE